MTDPTIALKQYLSNIGLDGDKDFLHDAVHILSQMIMGLEVEQKTGAGKHERYPERKNQRNGYRERIWETRVGEIDLSISKLRHGSYFPSLLEPRRRAEKALLAMVQQAYVEGVSTRKVDDLLQALGLTGIDMGFALGASEESAFWLEFLQRLERGLKGVQLVISDAHEGLKLAINQVLTGASWQRCRVHFMRNVLAHVPKRDKALVAALIRTIFARPDRQAAGEQLKQVAQAMCKRWPQAAVLLEKAKEDILAYMAFPPKHWTRIYSTNPLERLNKEVKHRTNAVGVFPDQPSVIRLVGSLFLEINDEWLVGRRYFSLETMNLPPTPNN